MPKKKNYSREDVMEELQEWLDLNSEIFNDILGEWQKHEIIKPHQNATQEFKCNHCGSCCYLDDYWVYCYASDIISWMESDEQRYDILCTLFPTIDEDGNVGYAIPSQRAFHEKIIEIFESKDIHPSVKNAFRRIREVVKIVNPSFNPNSDYCLYYNPNVKEHCMIYDVRPFFCQAYPYEFSNFTKIEIPTELQEKYVQLNLDDDKDLPICPAECYSENDPSLPTKISEWDLQMVYMNKANILSSQIAEKQFDGDVTALLLELFSSKIKNIIKKNREKELQNKEGKDKKSPKKPQN